MLVIRIVGITVAERSWQYWSGWYLPPNQVPDILDVTAVAFLSDSLTNWYSRTFFDFATSAQFGCGRDPRVSGRPEQVSARGGALCAAHQVHSGERAAAAGAGVPRAVSDVVSVPGGQPI